MTKYATRDVFVIPFRNLSDSVLMLNPEGLVVTFQDRGASAKDLGSMCYLNRKKTGGGTRALATKVDITSLDTQRIEQIRRLINVFVDRSATLSDATIGNEMRQMLNFMDWCDRNDHRDALANDNNGRRAFKEYVHFLKNRQRLGELKTIAAAMYQNYVLAILRAFYEIENIDEGINLISSIRSNHPTPPQDEDDQSRVLGWCSALFEGLSDLVLNEHPFPYKLFIPRLPGWSIDFLWVFPATIRYVSPHAQKRRESLSRPNWVVDYANGKLHHWEEVWEKYSGANTAIQKAGAKFVWESMKNRMDRANADPYDVHRLRLATLASQAFIHLFLANTGQNESPVLNLQWSGDFELETNHQAFRTIKWRAGGRKIQFEIQSNFLPSFHKYLKLRDYLLNGSSSELLFFNQGNNGVGKPRVWADITSNLHLKLRELDPDIPRFGTRQWRANKSEYINEHAGDLVTAAAMFDHTPNIHKSNYLAGTEGRTAQELSSFYEHVFRESLEKRQERDSANSIGHCENYRNPIQTEGKSGTQPDCEKPEGCLFCKQLYLHIDETDIRKLASCRYVIEKTAHLSASPEHLKLVSGPVLERINGLLEQIKNRGDEAARMVTRIATEVEDEEALSLYWDEKLNFLIKLGLVAE